MPLKINATLAALTSALELNAQGAVPQSLADQIAMTFAAEEYVYLRKRERVFLGGAGVAAGTGAGSWAFATTGGLVPQNEAWLILYYSVSAVIPIGLQATLQAACQMPFTSGGAAASFALGQPARNASSALASNVFSFSHRPIVLPPNGILSGITTELSAATAFNAFGVVDLVRLKI